MSDYMFMLENHLSGEQNRVVEQVQEAAAQSGVNLFLTGGAMRDVLGGFRVRDLDFSVEGNALKIAKSLAEAPGTRLVSLDENRRVAELVFPGGVTAQIALSRVERYGKPGARPQVTAATIQEDLRGRDFSVNAIALSLNRASRGLLLDPTNGLADLERRELRILGSYAFYDDPSRLLRLLRLKVRLGFSVDPRTTQSFANAREARMEQYIPARTLFLELKQIAAEANPSEVIRALESENLLALFSPALAGPKLNLPALVKLEKAYRLMAESDGMTLDPLPPFLYVLVEKLSPKERAALVEATEMHKSEAEPWQKLEARARKLEQALRSPRIRKPSHVYQVLSRAAGDEVAFLLYHSAYKPVQDRIRAYFQKYLPLLRETPAADLEPPDVKPGTARYQKAREERVWYVLDRRPPRKPAEPEEPPLAAEAAVAAARGRAAR